MTLSEVIPIIETLPHADKFKLIKFILAQLAKEEGIPHNCHPTSTYISNFMGYPRE